MSWLGSGKFWMWLWVSVLAAVAIWSVVTALFLMDSVRNLNALSLAALVLAAAAGVQATLGMRKADPEDPL